MPTPSPTINTFLDYYLSERNNRWLDIATHIRVDEERKVFVDTLVFC